MDTTNNNTVSPLRILKTANTILTPSQSDFIVKYFDIPHPIRMGQFPMADLLDAFVSDYFLSQENQYIITQLFSTPGRARLNCFAREPLSLSSSKFSFEYFDDENIYLLKLDLNYKASEFLFKIKEVRTVNTSIVEMRKADSLMMHYELFFPYYEFNQFFKDYNCYKFRISAHSCSSASLKIAVEVFYCNNKIIYAPPEIPKKGHLIISESSERRDHTASPPRFVAQSGLGLFSLLSNDTEQVLLKSAHDVTASIQDMSGDFKVSAKSITDLLSSLRENVKPADFKNFAESQIETLCNNFGAENFLTGFCRNGSIIAVIATGAYALMHRTQDSYFLFGTSIVAASWFNKSEIYRFILLFLERHNRPVAQSGMLGDDYFSAALLILTSLTFKNMSINKLPKETLSFLGSFSRIKSSLKDLFDFVIRLLDSLLASIGLSNAIPPWMKFINVKDQSTKLFCEKIDMLIERIRIKDFPINLNNYNYVLSLQREGRDISMGLKDCPPALVQILAQQNMVITKLKQEFLDANFASDGLRALPVCLILRGTPGTGKSQSMEWISRALCAATLPNEMLDEFAADPAKFVYARTAESVYWEGYKPYSQVCTIDDVFQARDVAGTPDNEYMNLIRVVDEIPYCLHMATLADKGNTYFRSPFVVCTTNMLELKSESIRSIEAIERRLHLSYECIPKEEYAMTVGGRKVIDPSKLPIGIKGETEIIPPDMLEYLEYDNSTKQYTGVVLDFQKLVNLMIKLYNQNKDRFTQKVSSLGKFADNIITIRRTPSAEEAASEFKTPDENPMDSVEQVFFEPKKGLQMDDVKEILNFRTPLIAQGNMLFNEVDNVSVLPLLLELHAEGVKGFEELISSLSNDRCSNLYMDANFRRLRKRMVKEERYMMCYSPKRLLKGLANQGCLLSQLITDQVAKDHPVIDLLIVRFKDEYEYPSFHEVWKFYTKDWNIIIDKYILKAKEFIFTPMGISLAPTIAWFKKNAVLISGSLAAIGLVTTLFATRKSGDSIFSQSLPQKNSDRNKVTKFTARGTLHSQMATGRDKNGSQLVDKFVSANCYEIFVHKPAGTVSIGFATFLVNRIAIMQVHFICGIQDLLEEGALSEDSLISFRLNRYAGRAPITYNFSIQEFSSFVRISDEGYQNDFCIIDFPLRVHMHRDIRHLLPSAADLAKIREYPVRLIVPKLENKQEGVCSAKPLNNIKIRSSSKIDSDLISIRTGYAYELSTEFGDCGAWLTLQVPHVECKLIGLHVAGDNGNMAFASALVLEEVNAMLKDIDPLKLNSEITEEDLSTDVSPVAQGQFIEQYNVKKVPFNLAQTEIKKSRLYAKWAQPLTAPAMLRSKKIDGVLIDPMEKALKKYCLPNIYIQQDDIKLAASIYEDTLHRGRFSVDPRLYSFEEAILGLEDEPDFGSLTRSTSAGYPYNVLGHKKKFTLFGSGETYDLETPEALALRVRCNDLIAKAKKGIRTMHIFHDNLKDERRPIEKVNDFSTRMFSASPVDLTVVTRMYFGAFVLFYHKNRISNGSAVGVNPYSTEWHTIATKLLNHGSPDSNCIGAGDFSRYDGSQKGDIHWLILDIINRWYDDGPENSLIREILWTEVTNSHHLNGKTVVLWPNSLPSGHAMTIIVNTMYNNIAFRYCWLQATKNTTISPHKFDTFVYLLAAGDDNIFSVDPAHRKIFNELTISKYMRKLGLIYTNETKGESTELLRQVGSVEFLKRSFRLCPNLNRYVAPLRLDVVLEIPMWTKKKYSDQIAISNVNNSIKELSLHGKEIFNKYVPKMAKAMYEEYTEWPETTNFTSCLHEIVNTVNPW
jgi:hypothetical protein